MFALKNRTGELIRGAKIVFRQQSGGQLSNVTDAHDLCICSNSLSKLQCQSGKIIRAYGRKGAAIASYECADCITNKSLLHAVPYSFVMIPWADWVLVCSARSVVSSSWVAGAIVRTSSANFTSHPVAACTCSRATPCCE